MASGVWFVGRFRALAGRAGRQVGMGRGGLAEAEAARGPLGWGVERAAPDRHHGFLPYGFLPYRFMS